MDRLHSGYNFHIFKVWKLRLIKSQWFNLRCISLPQNNATPFWCKRRIMFFDAWDFHSRFANEYTNLIVNPFLALIVFSACHALLALFFLIWFASLLLRRPFALLFCKWDATPRTKDQECNWVNSQNVFTLAITDNLSEIFIKD